MATSLQTRVSHSWFDRWRSSAFNHRATRISMYFFIIALLIFGLWVVFWPTFLPWLPQFAELVLQHRSPIRVLTACLALICALVFFWPREITRLVGGWNYYVGLAFGTFFVQYFLRYIDYKIVGPAGPLTVHVGIELVIYLCSGLNNLFFLAAARILLNVNDRTKTFPALGQLTSLQRVKVKLLNGLADFYAAIPKWALVVAPLASVLATLNLKPMFFWARFPDAIFSIYCISWFGYAVAINFNVKRRIFLSCFALIVSVSYGIGQLVYAANSVVAHTLPPSRVTSRPLAWIQQTVGYPVNNIVAQYNSTSGRPHVTPLDFMDSAVYVVLLPMKGALFLPPFLLYLLFIISMNEFRVTLSETTSRRKDYLSADGIVNAIGETLGAEQVSLFIRIPGIHKKDREQERVLPLIWRRSKAVARRTLQETHPIKAPPRILKLMRYEDVEFHRLENGSAEALASDENAPIKIAVPIRFHGGVIGVVETDLKGYWRFNHSTLQNLKLWADLVAPSVQDFRSLAAVDQMGFRLTRLQVDHRHKNLEPAIFEFLRIMHDVLSPLATGVFLEMGFVPFRNVCPEEHHSLKTVLENQAINNTRGTDKTEETVVGDQRVRLESCPMFVRATDVIRENDTRKGPVLGTLGLAIPAEKDPFSQPTLGAYYLNRKTVASLAADGILDIARNFFGANIKSLSVNFSGETLSLDQWFSYIRSAIEHAGLQWVVAVNCEGEEMPGEAIEFVTNLDHISKTGLLNQPLSSIDDSSKVQLDRVIRLNLSRSQYQLWLGVEREGFGRELLFQSPWRIYLSDLADMADSALKTFQDRQRMEAEKLHTAQYQGVMTIAVTTGTLIHQLVNMIKDQLYATESLQEALDDNEIKLDGEGTRLLGAMKRSAIEMQRLTQAFKNVTKLEERKPCSIKEAAEQAMKLFHVALTQRKIEAEILVSPQIRPNVPFHVAAFALANLIGNAKEAIRSNGSIRIEAEDDGNSILCHVTNSGPRISPQEQNKLFELGQSSKPGHNGWGLYFVSRSLQENGGGINLDTASPQTRFTIRLPKPGAE